MNLLRTPACILLALLSFVASSAAQQSIDHGSISGRISDPSGAVIVGAHVTIRHLDTNVAATVTTAADGRYRMPSLRVGEYEITVRHDGFADVSRRLTVSAGAAFELPLTLTLAGIDSAVTVGGETTVIESARSQIAATISTPEIHSLQ